MGNRRADGTYLMAGSDPGVPDSMPRALRALAAAVDPGRLDTLWLFPPLRSGRKETGVLAAGCLVAEPDRRVLVTLAYRSEETGAGIEFNTAIHEEGEAPRDRLPRIMAGVVRRMDGAGGDPRRFDVEGDPARLDEVLAELDAEAAREDGGFW
ncbi:MAG: hypothetical protein EA422_13335 [Gemmatimonadales bacterium]|nr:MAG: hypothetical protein EA422_13335 [Gemmatimonadales bacterium]